MFGLEKDFSNNIGFSRLSCCMISVFTRGVALAVKARKGVFGKYSLSVEIFRYAGLKSCPHWDTQCASSIVIKFIGSFFMRSIIQSDCKRSGDK